MPKKMSAKKSQQPVVQKVCNYHGCKKQSIGSISSDIDLAGLAYCNKHKSDIKSAYLWLTLGIEELAHKAMGINTKKK